jgi:hypothetical protein
MSEATLEERVARLEAQMAVVLENGRGNESHVRPPLAVEPGRDDWKKTVGMFRGDPVFKEMLDEAARLREEDRRQARDAEAEQTEREDEVVE